MVDIAPDCYEALCLLAKQFNEWVPPERVKSAAAAAPSDAKGDRPGDDFNRRAAWPEVLERHGWTVERTAGEVTYWTRPGKRVGTSATTGKCKSDGGGDLLYVFSSNAHPLEPDTAYSKFAAVAMLDHAGDFERAASALAARGYGAHRPGPRAEFPSGAAHAPADGRRFKWASELRAPEQADDWIWHGYLPAGAVALLSALWKVGKTTLLSHLLKACGTGGEFLGRPIKACKVLYVSEEGERHWVRRRDALPLSDNVGFHLQPFATRPAQAGWDAFVKGIAEDVKTHGFDLVVFDTLAKLWPVTEENDASAVDAALMPLWNVTKAGAGVLLIHHLRKSGGQEYTGSRGSGALSAFPDILIELVRHDAGDARSKKRVINAKGRYDETPDELVIELVNGEYVAVTKAADEPGVEFPNVSVPPDLDAEESRVFGVLRNSNEPWLTSDDIRDALRKATGGRGMRDKDVITALDALYQKKQIVLGGKLRSKSDPRKYALASRVDLVPPLGVTGNETPEGDVSRDSPSPSHDLIPRDTQGRNETGAASIPMWWALLTNMLHTNGEMPADRLVELSGYDASEVDAALRHYVAAGVVVESNGVYRVGGSHGGAKDVG